MRRSTLRSTISPLLLALLASPALAQQSEIPDEALLPQGEQEDVVLRAKDAGGNESMSGLDLPDPRPAWGEELPEGTFLTGAQGIVVPLTAGGWAFVFDADTEGKADPPMVLQPSMQTAAMLRLVQASDDTMTLRIAGEVQRYLGRHYLLPYRFDVVSGEESAEQKPAEERAEEAQEQLEQGGEETADDIASRVDRAMENTQRRSIPNATTPGEADVTPDSRITLEGTLVIDLAGRVGRNSSGLWVFTTDNDADNAEIEDDDTLAGEITLVPCLMLQALERELNLAPSRARLTLSGRVLVFEGDNYLLPTLFRLAPDTGGNLSSAQ